ncbi:helix-turn-helix domain-containing protein [Zophobihabitans entericus]|uniref:Helix-turn-helix domain-containing protein n=1 Tax=Zophobihabitans entericus TaxID=1635327 RepID=A0A6G9IA62_9GAMM|nr:helix-turn-helix domain-containing protein [Zophobihabitans entericus]QIQ21111.1 helix-turn-helix domain-containing protein [Zophobihabitans entericus]
MSAKSLSEYNLTANQKTLFHHNGYNGVTLLYVIKGQVDVTSEELCVTLYTGDLLLINNNTEYEIQSEQENIVITLEVSNFYFSRYYKNYFYHKYILLPQNYADFKRKYVENIQLLLAKMMVAYIKSSEEAALEINRQLSEILLILVSFFKEKNISTYKNNSAYSSRIEKTIQFLDSHYNQDVSLQKMAEREHVSFAYLSRLFKKEVGIGFMQYLTKLKFQHAVHDLINTSKPVYRIIEDHGFSNTKQFINLFKKVYNNTPNQFRNEYKKKPDRAIFIKKHVEIEEMKVKEANINEVVSILSDIINNSGSREYTLEQYSHTEEQVISLSGKVKSEGFTTLEHIVTIGELNELLKEDVRQQIVMLKQASHINYVDTYHLISGNTILPEFATDEPIPTYSPYNNSDIALSFLKQHNIHLFVRLYHANIREDPYAYIEKSTKFFKHCISLYGFDYVKKWQFVYYIEDKQAVSHRDLETCYFLVRDSIKAYLPDAKVGFYYPASEEIQFKTDPFFTSDIAKSMDFFGYTASFSEHIDLDKISNKPFGNEITYIQEKTKHIKQGLKFHGINIPLVLMKWNSLTGNTRHTNGSFFRAALIFHTLLDLAHHINSVGISLNTEIQQETQVGHIDVSGIAAFYLFNTKRPLFYVLQFMDKLKGKIIAQGDGYLVTKTYFGYQVVLTNLSVFNPYLSVQEHLTQSFKKRKIMTFHGIESGQYQIRKYIFDQQHGALYKQYERFQTKYGRDYEVFDYLNRNTMPDFTVYDESINNEQWTVLSELDINAIHFYELKKAME